jgi:GT2 family glycosyltransferase
MSDAVTVIVPVYAGIDDVRRCLDSVLRHCSTSATAAELLVIDDASPEQAIRDHLRTLEASSSPLPIRVLTNTENVGFVGSVNRGLTSTAGDVIVLNADTVVTEGWLDRMAAAAAEPDVATVTPLTNFGSICTVPTSVIDAFDLAGHEPRIDECARFVSEASLHLLPEVITGVGFCLYVRRDAIVECGLLDEETFGLGYGEEVDFCLRATRLGFRHLVEDSTFVYHRGGGSFGDRREEGLRRGSALIHARHPYFRAANRRQRSESPLAVPFATLELSVRPRRDERPHVLHLVHEPSAIGGTEGHLEALMEALAPEIDSSVLYPTSSGFVLRTRWEVGDDGPARHELLLPTIADRAQPIVDLGADAALHTVLDMFDIDAIHIQNLIGHSLAPLAALRSFDGAVVCSVRDQYLACPNHSLLYRGRQACGIPDDLSVCGRCLPETTGLPVAHLRDFRAFVEAHLDRVDHWVFASQSAADYLLRVYDLDPDRIEIIPHGALVDVPDVPPTPDEAHILEAPLRLAFVGRGWRKKGLAVVNDLADRLQTTDIHIHHFGEDRETPSPNLHLEGAYPASDLPRLLREAGIHIVLLPGPYAETFGHVLTEAMVTGLPVIGTRYGALGERIRRSGAGWTVDPDDPDSICSLVQDLDRCRAEVLRASRRACGTSPVPVDATASRYAALYQPPEGRTPATTTSRGAP